MPYQSNGEGRTASTRWHETNVIKEPSWGPRNRLVFVSSEPRPPSPSLRQVSNSSSPFGLATKRTWCTFINISRRHLELENQLKLDRGRSAIPTDRRGYDIHSQVS